MSLEKIALTNSDSNLDHHLEISLELALTWISAAAFIGVVQIATDGTHSGNLT
jgi:hypothetical protein